MKAVTNFKTGSAHASLLKPGHWYHESEAVSNLALLIYADLCELVNNKVGTERLYWNSQIEAIRCIADDKGL